MNHILPPSSRVWVELAIEIADAAAHEARRRLRRRPERPGAFKTRRPGPSTPLWNRCRETLKHELRHHGAKTRLARHLGIPKQRVTDFLRGHRRMPDAETLLGILEWVAAKQRGRDESL